MVGRFGDTATMGPETLPEVVTEHRRLNLSLGAAEHAGVDYAPLVRAAAGGDRQALERLLMRAQEVALRFSVTVCGHVADAEDVMQEALLKTYRYVDRIRDPEAFRPWLYRTVRNACLMKRRRRVDEPATLLSLDEGPRGQPEGRMDVPDSAKTPDEIAMNRWLGRRLRQALKTLPSQYRVVVLLREVEGLSTREVADVMGVTEANVKTRLHRARAMLRESLGDV